MKRRITATVLSDYYQCPLKAWHYSRRDSSERDKPGPLSRAVLKAGNDYENRVVASYDPVKVSYRRGDFAAGYKRTLKVISEGAPHIHHGIMYHQDEDFEYVCEMDLLHRDEQGEAGAYFISEIKNSASIKGHYILQLCLNIWLLEKNLPRSFHHRFIASRLREYPFDYDSHRAIFQYHLKGLRDLLQSDSPPEFSMKQGCSWCQWHTVCFSQARESRVTGLVQGISERDLHYLKECSLSSLDELAAQGEDLLLPGREASHSVLIGRRAKSLVFGEDLSEKYMVSNDYRAVLIHTVRDLVESKEIIAAVTLNTENGSVQVIQTDDKTDFSATLSKLITGIKASHIVATSLSVKKVLLEEVILPTLRGDPADVHRIKSLEGMALNCLALPVGTYSFYDLCMQNGFLAEDRTEPELTWHRQGRGASFSSHLKEIILAAGRLYSWLTGEDQA